MSEQTTNYKLTKLDSAEIGSMIDLNSNVDKVDAALKQNHDTQQLHMENNNNPHIVTKEQIGLGNADNTSDKDKPVSTAQQIALDGKADLGTDGRVPASQLPSYVDDVLEYGNKIEFPNPGESGKIYVATENNLTYRWSGTAYVEISPSLALGETANTAYRGDLGKQNAKNLASLSGVVSEKAAASHTHSTADITSGTLPVARGGTGQTTVSGVKSALGISNLENKTIDTGWVDIPLSGYNVIWNVTGRARARRIGNLVQLEFENIRSAHNVNREVRIVNSLDERFLPAAREVTSILAIPSSGIMHGGYMNVGTDGVVTIAPLEGASYIPYYGVYARIIYMVD